MNEAGLLWGVLFGSIGLGYSYFIDNTFAIVAIGSVLTALPYFIRLQSSCPTRVALNYFIEFTCATN